MDAADEVVERLVAAADDRDERQHGVGDAQGQSASYTGGGWAPRGRHPHPPAAARARVAQAF